MMVKMEARPISTYNELVNIFRVEYSVPLGVSICNPASANPVTVGVDLPYKRALTY